MLTSTSSEPTRSAVHPRGLRRHRVRARRRRPRTRVWPRTRGPGSSSPTSPPFNVLVVPSLAGDPVVERTLRDAAEVVLRRRRTPRLEGLDGWERCIHPAIPPARGLHEVAEEEGADLIVVGSTHRRGARSDRARHDGREAPARVPLPGPRGSRRLADPTAGRAFAALGAGFDGSPQSRSALSAAAALARADRRLAARDRRVRAAQPRQSRSSPSRATATTRSWATCATCLEGRLEDGRRRPPERRRRQHPGARRRPRGRPCRRVGEGSTCSRWAPAATERCAP